VVNGAAWKEGTQVYGTAKGAASVRAKGGIDEQRMVERLEGGREPVQVGRRYSSKARFHPSAGSSNITVAASNPAGSKSPFIPARRSARCGCRGSARAGSSGPS